LKLPLLSQLRSFGVPTHLDDREAERARVLQGLVAMVLAVGAAASLLALIILPQHALRWLGSIATLTALGLAVLSASRAGYVRAASIVLIVGMSVSAGLFSMGEGGFRSPPAYGGLLVIVLFAGILLGESAALVTAVLLELAGLALVQLEAAGRLPTSPQLSPLRWWFSSVLYVGLALGVTRMAIRSLGSAMAQGRRQLLERIRTEQALRDSETRLRALSEATFEGIVLGERGRFVDLNDQLAQMLGTTRSALLGTPILDTIAPRSRESVRQAIEANSAGYFAHFARRADGTEFPVEVRVRNMLVGGREMRAAVVRDQTLQTQAELALRESAERIRSLGDNLPSGAIYEVMRDDDGWHFSYISAGIERLVGISAEALKQDATLFENGMSDADRALLIARREEAYRTVQPMEFECRWRMPDGEERWMHIRSAPRSLADGRTVWDGIVIDLTELKRVQIALEDARTFLQEVVDQSPGMIFVKDEAGRIVFANRYAAEYYRITPEQLIAQATADVHAEPAEAAQFSSDDQEVIRTRTKVVRDEVNTAPDGQKHWFHTVKVPLIRRDGRVDVLGIATDITERRRAEEQRLQLQLQVQQAQKLEGIGVLAGGVAHDFNNILGAILGNIELAEATAEPDHLARESLAEIRRASLRARELVQQILTFSRQHPPERHPIQLREVVEESVRLLRSSLPAGVELVTRFGGEEPCVLADRIQISQVIMNLGTNAWQALPGGTGRIEIGLGVSTVDVGIGAGNDELGPGSYARLTVADNGVGMDAQTLARIFDPFFTTKAPGEGTGLGLSVVHGIMKTHGGAIVASSRPGEGSLFELYFPIVPAAATLAGASAVAMPAGSGQRVLYLDDEVALVEVEARLLERHGYVVRGFARVDEALAVLRSDPEGFDLVITDLNMPGMSGLEVAVEVARLRADLPIVLSSGYVTDDLSNRALALGIRAVVRKPHTTLELLQALHNALSDPVAPDTAPAQRAGPVP